MNPDEEALHAGQGDHLREARLTLYRQGSGSLRNEGGLFRCEEGQGKARRDAEGLKRAAGCPGDRRGRQGRFRLRRFLRGVAPAGGRMVSSEG